MQLPYYLILLFDYLINLLRRTGFLTKLPIQTTTKTPAGIIMLVPPVMCKIIAPLMYALNKSVPNMFVLGNKNKSAATISPTAIIIRQSAKFICSICCGSINFPPAQNKYSAVSNPAIIHPAIFLVLLISVFILF